MPVPISFEFFPPKTPEGVEKLRAVRQRLYALGPQYCSVTYGAGGSTRDGTFEVVGELLAEGVDAACHFSCIGATRATITKQLDRLKQMGVRRLVALRGDLPSGYGGGGEFRYASDLIAFIREHSGNHFHIAAAGYPEVHPQAVTAHRDMDALVAKVAAGADEIITQMFFNVDGYWHYVDEIRARGLDVPVVPGIMPISSSSSLLRFADSCGADVPRWLRMRLMGLGDDVAAITDFGADVMARLCQRLVDEGVPALHFYTVNRADPTHLLCQRLGRVTASALS